MFRSLPLSVQRGGVVKCSLVPDSLNTEPAPTPVLLRPGGEGRLGGGVSESGYVEFDFPLPALCDERNGIVYSEFPN